ncbi:RNA pseudouridylate synthase domain-containing protein 1-like isoform X2 [Bombus flavifrons]|uniref:RNA pseudouridylate synthase domain-containing protein 1-like isoform X2 n=1 Tax=Bombus flavifrons TaxID=103934 RepID=UPI00212BF4D2
MNINKILYNCRMFILKLTQILKVLLKLYTKYFIEIKHKNNVNILYHSENFLVVSKPYDMCINSNNREKKDTLQFELKKILPKLVNPNLFHEFHFVHRLDYVTSGVICIALNKKAARAASNVFEARTAKKFYLALLHGHINEPYLIIDKAIGIDAREKKGNHKMCTSDNLFCRRHQLRVHCSYIGHTVIGDYTYSERKDIEPYRTFLHSFRLILNNEMENLDVRSTDPFVASDPRNQWSPTNIARILDEDIFYDIYNLLQSNKH